MDSTILIHEEGNADPSSSPFESRKHLFMHVSDTVMKGSVEFSHLCVKGTFAEGGYVERGGTSIALNYYRSIYIHHCRFVNKSQMNMANEYIVSAQVQHNEFDSTCRDMARFRSSWNCFIAQNRFLHCDDDAVALHQAVYVSGTGNIREGIIVADNTFEDTCGIHILGGRVVNVHDNILRRVKQTVISIDSDSSEGVNPMFAINVHDNQIFDSIIRPDSFPQSQFACIGVNYGGVYGRPTGSPAPMENQSGTQTFLAPYAYRDVQGGASTYPGMFGINIHDNLIQRTLPTVANYSAWGVGQCFSVSGFVDPPVTDAELRPSAGIVVQSDARAIRIHGNTISCASYGVILDSPTRNFSGIGSKIYDNLFYDCVLGGIQINSPGAQQNMQIWIDGNEFNLDPYCLSANRGAAGSWQADSGPYGVACNGVSGLLVTGNVFSNLGAPLSGSVSAMWNARGNWARCQPNVTGFSTLNKGIGNIPVVGDRFTIDTFYSDPTQSNYQTPMNTSSFSNESSGMPTAGFWMAGTFVRNVNTAVAAYGYYRLTTGSGNVSGTDWKTVSLS
ncbi:hypothetical protein SAMN05446927_5395 [Caballeronia arationis]|uniref:Right handed beta helix domain-containing protein n=1 Tax=Caballeronia arationis TaxID=1777142 RepID=A0A7Z7IB51_9BURK|nr:hypothetical protein [Caballeronia arationis]SOE82086.1 hypothetical protein SAMN05446927_5395 [Caballeronia arationis]